MNLQEKCPVCASSNSKYLFQIQQGQLIECDNCHLFYYTPQPSAQELENFYNSEDYRNEFSESLMSGTEFASNRYLQFEKALKKYTPKVLTQSSRNLLDIGCGTGDFLQIANQNGWQVSGTEISTKAVQEISKKTSFSIFSGDILSLDLPQKNYDVITLYHVIEHLIAPNEFLKRIRELLKPGGLFFLETPNIGGIGFKIKRKAWSHLIPPEHIIYFNPSSLKFTLKKVGFEDIKTLTISPQIIESLQAFPPIIQTVGKSVYDFSCLLDMGPTLQAIAFRKPD